MYFVIYVSSAVKQFSSSELIELLEKSRKNNLEQNITGMLLYKDGNFMQLVEGEEEAVNSLESKIRNDLRHRNMIILLKGYIEHRQFSEWSMGFRDLSSQEILSTPGYSEFMNTPLTGEEFSSDPTRAQKLLLTFKKNM